MRIDRLFHVKQKFKPLILIGFPLRDTVLEYLNTFYRSHPLSSTL